MSYTETGDQYTYFTEEEDKKILKFLKKIGYEADHNTPCGSCCGMYEDEYWVGGIGAKLPDEIKQEIRDFLVREKIDGEFDNRYTIKARG